MFCKAITLFTALFAVAAATNTLQVVNTNANLQSSSNNHYPYSSYRPYNHVWLSGAVRNYQNGGYPYSGYPNNDYYYPSSHQGYRYRRQVSSPLVREANSQYQYQGNNQYDERVNPMYYGNDYANNAYPFNDAYRYREYNQYQLQGNAQSRVEGDPRFNSDLFNNRYQSQQQGALYRQRYNF